MKYVKKAIAVKAFRLGYDEEPEWFIDLDKEGNVKRHIGHSHSDYYIEMHSNGSDGSWAIYNVLRGNVIVHCPFRGAIACEKRVFDAYYELESMAEGTHE
jgi:hypothetical protein